MCLLTFYAVSRRIGGKQLEITATLYQSFPGGSDGKEFTCNVGDLGLDSRLGLEKGKVTNTSSLAWRIPLTEESGGLPFMSYKESDND